ncbi:hypothetical protein EBB59_05710 [Lysobacter pythonis]|uniref:MarR family transcriptional regulator n=1 Tax=Solilutibacter pythonis TaxID=2483112 RepID=A0A3M2I4G8_9GAMM|nr:hypothetical protein [Lysobacter pythonis]RMH93377.1 hypothetical protein EBB59_05710 [Lysobacter pythonis]
MRFHKTLRAHTVLATQGRELAPSERRALILCDGQRNIEQIVAILGPRAAEAIQVLEERGYLERDDKPARPGSRTAIEPGVA